jgi:hypothetical protein
MLRTQAVGMRPCRPRSGLLTWHPSASTADSLLGGTVPLHLFFLSPPLKATQLLYLTRKSVRARQYATYRSGAGPTYTCLITYSPLMDLISPAALQEVQLCRPLLFSARWWFFLQRNLYCLFLVGADFTEQANLFLHHNLKLCEDVKSFQTAFSNQIRIKNSFLPLNLLILHSGVSARLFAFVNLFTNPSVELINTTFPSSLSTIILPSNTSPPKPLPFLQSVTLISPAIKSL